MKKVDLSQARSNDVAHFRCGGSALIYKISRYEGSRRIGNYEIHFGDDIELSHFFGVRGEAREMNQIFDIVRIQST